MAIGFALAMLAERVNVAILGRWSYAPEMPTLLTLGLAPVAQWLLLPPLILWLARTHIVGRITLARREPGR